MSSRQLVNQKLKREVQQVQRKQDEVRTKQMDTSSKHKDDRYWDTVEDDERRVRECENYNFPPIILTHFKPITEAMTPSGDRQSTPSRYSSSINSETKTMSQ